MSTKMIGLIVGGLIPAVLLGFAGVFQKLAGQFQLGAGPFLIVTGLTTTAVGTIYLCINHIGLKQELVVTSTGIGMAFLFGLFWSVSSGLISVSMKAFGASISQLAPLYNMNTLTAVLLGLMLLAEWKTVSPPRIIIASLFIIVGGLLAAKS